MSKIMIADVLYTETDNTFYVLNRMHENTSEYFTKSLEGAFEKLISAGWSLSGKVYRSDQVLVDMMSDGNGNYIAVWEVP